MKHYDERLPEPLYVYERSHDDFQVCEGGFIVEVAQPGQRPWNVKAGKDVDEAVAYYLNNVQLGSV